MIQELIDDARGQVFADYDMFEAIRTRALDHWMPEFIALPVVEGLSQLEGALGNAVLKIEAAGGQRGLVQIYVRHNGRELVFVVGIHETEKGICALELKRNTGDPVDDLLPLTDMNDDASRVLGSIRWGGSRRRVDSRITDYITI